MKKESLEQAMNIEAAYSNISDTVEQVFRTIKLIQEI